MQKKERQLSQKEQQRKKIFDALCETMAANGYIKYDLTVGIVAANVLAVLVMAPFMAMALWIFHLTVPKGEVTFTAWDGAAMLLMIIALIVIHELIHGLTWGCFAKQHFKSIDFGVIWSMLTPYCTCAEFLTRWQYLLGVLMPTLVLGFCLMAAACMLHSIFWFALAELMILSGGGDFLIFYKIMLHKSRGTEAYYCDHPYECGVVVFEKPGAV